MVANHYRWDFVGLSTDTKPTPETSEKVVDGSTYYCSDTSKLYVYCKDNWYERKSLGGGGGGTTYTAGEGIDITSDVISVDQTTIQGKLTAGSGIDITDDIISATGGSSSGVKFLTSADYNYPTDNPTSVNPGMLNPGIYFVADETVNVFNGANSLTSRHHLVFVISASDGVTGQNEMMVINDTTVAADSDYKINFYYTNTSTGATVRRKGLLDETYIADNLTTNSAAKVLSAKQGRALNLKIISPIETAGVPTTSTIGVQGQIDIDTTNGDAYVCVSTTGGTYTWKKITS